MKVKLKNDFYYVDEDKEFEEPSTIVFEKNKQYDVVHVFEHDDWGELDNTVFVVVNHVGDTMSVSKENCEIVESEGLNQ